MNGVVLTCSFDSKLHDAAFKASVIKKIDELEKSALLEIQTASQDSISQHAVSTANYMMLVTEKVHNKIRMS
jgi:hypothetical protein